MLNLKWWWLRIQLWTIQISVHARWWANLVHFRALNSLSDRGPHPRLINKTRVFGNALISDLTRDSPYYFENDLYPMF